MSCHSNENHAITPAQSSRAMILKERNEGIVEIFAENDSRKIHYDANLRPEKSRSNDIDNVNDALKIIISLVSL